MLEKKLLYRECFENVWTFLQIPRFNLVQLVIGISRFQLKFLQTKFQQRTHFSQIIQGEQKTSLFDNVMITQSLLNDYSTNTKLFDKITKLFDNVTTLKTFSQTTLPCHRSKFLKTKSGSEESKKCPPPSPTVL